MSPGIHSRHETAIPIEPGTQASVAAMRTIMDLLDYSPEVESTARMLASAAGVSWDKLQRHPGYGRNHWREQASSILGPLGIRLTVAADPHCAGAWATTA